MRIITFLVRAAIAGSATAAGAQATPQGHQHPQQLATTQHQGMEQHQMAGTGEKCCCEEMMKKMMSEMIQSHQGMEMHMQKDAPSNPPPHAH
jgi:hypothetical protein